ncbi:unnamed protein product [Clonostachys rosea f. rosea IK726]|uniref:Uncharacterized protein n=2 Tax=Bionectria ochroleuca TaxID=29856 RepID=A0A0B7K060_BIOOC|nr:unnamed protein product [Clonostachys rosea f. rosea IK726]
MRRILLTSSQVSVLLTSFVVISCTCALFLSGYVIQQRTLRDLRTAIRPRQPRHKPQMHLPDQFKKHTQRLADGTVVQIESEAEREANKRPVQHIEVAPTVSRAEEPRLEVRHTDKVVSREKLAIVEQLQADVARKSWAAEHPDPLVKSRVPITRAERRRLIREELRKLSDAEESVYYQRRMY